MTIRLGRVAGCLALALATACADKIAPPQANAGSAITANMGSSVLLDGRSSSDPQGRALAYDWSFASRPAASRASFNDAHIATPSFVPDLDGVYMVSLVVSNGVLSSAASQVQVNVKKCGQAAPDITAVTASPANPITDTSVQLTVTVHDADNDPACNLGQTSTVLWTSVGLPTAIVDPTATTTSFKPSQIGAYQFSVVATDSTGLSSAPKFITVNTSTCGAASPSIASAASSSANPNPGDVVTLSAVVDDADNGASCNLGQTLRYEWRLASRPAGSSAALSDPTAVSPTITPDAIGTYQFLVTVTDSTGRVSNSKSVSFTTTACGGASPVIASVTATPAVPNIGTAVTLSVAASDADNGGSCNKGQTLTRHWALVTRPAASSAFLNDPVADSPSFTPDVVGTYQFSVTVSDGTGNSSAPTFLGVATTNCGTHAPSVTIDAIPSSPVPFAPVQLTPTVTDADNAGTCVLNQSFTYAWTLTRPPSSVSAELSDPGAQVPSFTPDVPGAYRATLTVTDSAGLSSAVAVRDVFVRACGAAAVTFSTPPISVSLSETEPNVGAPITLTAAASDPGTACGVPAGPVQYVWTLAGPSGSTAAAFALSAGAQFTFTPDVVGTYEVSVKAVDLVGGQSATVSTSVSTTTCGAAPISVAVAARSSAVNSFQSTTVTATPAASSCPARFAPQIAWSVAGPAAARLSRNFGNSVDFTAAGPGTFTVSAVAINATGHEGPAGSASIDVSACGSHAPVVTSLSNSPTFPARKQTVTLSATAADPDAACGAALGSSISFELLSAPQGSTLSFAAGASTFQGDVEGTYAFRVVATETGTGLRSDAAVLNVTVLDPDPNASSVTAVPASGAFVVADNVDSATVTVTLRNRLGQPVAALPVAISATDTGSTNTFTPGSSGTSDVNGVFTATLKSTKAELKTITVVANSPAAPVTLNSHPTVEFVAGPTASIVLTGLPPTVTAGAFSTVTVTAFDAFANVAKGPNAYRGTVRFTSTDTGAAAAFPPDYTFLAGDDGTKTFLNGVRLVTAGSRTVTVKDTGNASLTDSQTALVNAAAPDSVAFTVQPTTATAGIAISPAVETTVKDAFANLVPNAAVTVSIATGPVGATLAGTTPQLTNPSGVASFATLTITKSGTYTLHAAVTGTPGADSNSFGINPAAPATAVFFQQPTSATAGVAISPAVTVTVKDTFTNLVPNASVSMTLGTNPTAAALLGTTTQTTDGTGVATFADLKIQKAGIGYKLHAAVTGTPGDDSTAFDITAAAPATVAFTVQPSSANAGANITPAVQTTVKDAFANPVSGASVALSLATNPGLGTLSGTLTQSTNGSGIATFANLTIDKTGVGYSLHAAVTGTPGADSTLFDITAAAPATATFNVEPSNTTAGEHITPAVQITVKDAFANLVPGASVTVALGDNPGLGLLTGTLTQLTNASGVASFANLSIDKTGTGYTLHAVVASTPLDITADSAGFNITAAAPATVAFTVQPTTTVAGVHITPAVETTVKDAFSNLVPGASVTLSFAVNAGGGTLSGTLTQATSALGVASFADLTIDKTGTGYKLHAAVTGTPGADSIPFAITPDVATHFAVTTTSPATAGIAQAFVVTARDRFENTATGYTGSVTFTSSDAAAVFVPTSHSFVTADGGVFSTGTVEFRTSGSQTIHASDGSISGTSAGVTVNPGAAASLALTGLPAVFPAGTPQPITVTLSDAFGNVATGYTGNVNFTSTSSFTGVASHTFSSGSGGDNGVFVANVDLTTAGPQTLTATDSGNAALTSTQSTTVAGLSFATRAGTNPPVPPSVVGNTSAAAVATFSDGSFAVTGSFSNDATWGSGEATPQTVTATGISDFYLARFNADGTLRWVRTVGGTAADTVQGFGVAACDGSSTCTPGSVVAAGNFTGTINVDGTPLVAATSATEMFLVQFDAAGTAVWAKQTVGSSGPPASSVTPLGLAGFSDGSTVATGSFNQDVTFGLIAGVPKTLTGGGFFLARFDPDGNLLSATSAGASGTVTGVGVTAVAADGGAIAVGTFTADTTFDTTAVLVRGAQDGFIVKYAADGTTVAWATSFGGTGGATFAEAVAAFANGSAIITGSFSGIVTFGGGSGDPALTATGGADVFVTRLNASDGTTAWAKQAGSLGSGGRGFGVATFDSDGSAAVVGTFNSPSTSFAFGSKRIVSLGENDAFIARYAGADGSVTSARSAGGPGTDAAFAVAGFADRGAVVVGTLGSPGTGSPTDATFGGDVEAQTKLLTTQDTAQDAFHAKYYPYAN